MGWRAEKRSRSPPNLHAGIDANRLPYLTYSDCIIQIVQAKKVENTNQLADSYLIVNS
jgi:hypothetical protein